MSKFFRTFAPFFKKMNAMKKILFVLPLVALLFSCKSKDEPAQQHAVTFHVPGLAVETQPMNAPAVRRTPVLTDDDGQQMTDLIVWDGSTYLLRQQNTDPDFGTITLMLTTGAHHLHFIATRSTGLSIDEGVLYCTSLRPTFGKHYDIDVTGSSDNNVSLDRLTGQVVITIEDEVPTGANELRIQFGDYYKGINPGDFSAVRSGDFDQTVSISGKVGSSNNEYKVNVLAPVYGTQSTTTFTLTATNAGGDIIGQATGTMPICSNTKTLVHGNLFTGTRSFLSLSTSWGADSDVDF